MGSGWEMPVVPGRPPQAWDHVDGDVAGEVNGVVDGALVVDLLVAHLYLRASAGGAAGLGAWVYSFLVHAAGCGFAAIPRMGGLAPAAPGFTGAVGWRRMGPAKGPLCDCSGGGSAPRDWRSCDGDGGKGVDWQRLDPGLAVLS